MPAESRHLRSNGFETAMLIAFKLKLALVCAAGLAGPLAVAPLINHTGSPRPGRPARQALGPLPPRAVSPPPARPFTSPRQQAPPPRPPIRFSTPPPPPPSPP